MTDSRPVEILREAARLNREDPLLRGSLMVFPNYGQLVMTGDLRYVTPPEYAEFADAKSEKRRLSHRRERTFRSDLFQRNPDTLWRLLWRGPDRANCRATKGALKCRSPMSALPVAARPMP